MLRAGSYLKMIGPWAVRGHQMSGQTLTAKIVTRYCVRGPSRPLRTGDLVTLRPRHLMSHDNSAAIMDRFASMGAGRVRYPWQPVIAIDHDVQNTDPERLETWHRIERFARDQGIEFWPCGSGIGHQIMVADGYVTPGSLCVAADSHANIYGALGCLGTAIVRSDAAAVWATGEFWWELPRVVQVVLSGELAEGVTGKDLILSLCGRYCDGEVHNAVVEFTGAGVASLDIDDRFTVANMTTEWGALAGIFPVDGRRRHISNGCGASSSNVDAAASRLASSKGGRENRSPPIPTQSTRQGSTLISARFVRSWQARILSTQSGKTLSRSGSTRLSWWGA